MALPTTSPLFRHINGNNNRLKHTKKGLVLVPLLVLLSVIGLLIHAGWTEKSDFGVREAETLLLDIRQQQNMAISSPQAATQLATINVDRVQQVLTQPTKMAGDTRDLEKQLEKKKNQKVEPIGVLDPPVSSPDGEKNVKRAEPTTEATTTATVPQTVQSTPAAVEPSPEPEPFDFEESMKKYFGAAAANIRKTIPSNCQGKERVILFLILSGTEIPKDLCPQLPSFEAVTAIYGAEPVVHNRVCGNLVLEPKRREVLAPRISGPANVGIGMLKRMLKWNVDRIGYKTKLSPVTQLGIASRESLFRRFLHWIIPNDPPKPYLRVVLAKDPFAWMQSICLCPSHLLDYPPAGSMEEEMEAALGRSPGQRKKQDPHCPHLVTRVDSATGQPISYGVNVTSSDELAHKKIESFPSLVHYWNEFFSGFLTKEEPQDGDSKQDYIVIRYEDLLFHPLETMRAVGECAGLPVVRKTRKPLTFLTMGSKQLRLAERSSEFLDRTVTAALVFYANGNTTSGIPQRTAGMTELDITYAAKHLDAELLKRLGYRLPQASLLSSDSDTMNTNATIE